MTRSRRIGVAVGAIIFAFALYEIVTSFVAYTADAYVQSDLVRLAPQVTGHILAVHVADNQSVAEGDPLVTIDPTPFQLEVEQHKAEVDGARARVAVDQDLLGSVGIL